MVFNTFETHLLPSQKAILQNTQEQENIISLAGSNFEMDMSYQTDTTFSDIAQQLALSTYLTANHANNRHQPANTHSPPTPTSKL